MHLDDNMVKAMRAAMAAAMAQVLNNANNANNNNNQDAPQAPARGAHHAVAAADDAQPLQPVRGARAASRGRGAAAQPPAPLSPEAQLIAQLQRLREERFARGAAILRRVGCPPTFRMREVAISTLALAKAMYGVELADVGSRDVVRLELAAVRPLWGPTHTSRAKEVLWAVLVPGHRVSPVWGL